MIEKRIKIYIGSDLKPYLDKEHTKPLPQVSDNTYIGENNATILDFDLSELDDFATALINIKKPDNEISYELLEQKTIDNEIMFEASLQSYYLNQKGALIISVNLYQGGNIEILGDDGNKYIELNGDEMLLTTSPIKLYINYTPYILPNGKELTVSDLQKLLYALSTKTPLLRTINGKTLETNIILKALDIGIETLSIGNATTIQEALELLKSVQDENAEDISSIEQEITNIKNGSQIVGKSSIAVKDEDDRLLTSLETKSNVASEINKIKDGTYISKKAEQDKNGNDIVETYVPKTRTILGIDLSDNVLLNEFKEAIGTATTSLSGLMSAEDKSRLDALHSLLGSDDENNVVNTINEILAIFDNYPEGVDLVSALAGKVDKVIGKGLSTNDYTDNEKDKVQQSETHRNTTGNPHGTTKSDIGLANVVNPTIYGGQLVDDLNSITYSGFYTCYSGATGLSTEMNALGISFHIVHSNSNVGTGGAMQMATGFNSGIMYNYQRLKVSGTWGNWFYVPTKADIDLKSNLENSYSNKIGIVSKNTILENTKIGEKIRLKISGDNSTTFQSLLGTQNVASDVVAINNTPYILCKNDGGFTATLASGNKTATFITGHKYACIIELNNLTNITNPQSTSAGCYNGTSYINFINNTSAYIDTENNRICISGSGSITTTQSYSRIFTRLVLNTSSATINVKKMVIIDLTSIGKDSLSTTDVYNYFKNSISSLSSGSQITFYSKLGAKISGKNLYNNNSITYQNASSKVSYSLQNNGIKVLLNEDFVSGSGSNQVNVLNYPISSLNLKEGDLITISCEKEVSLSTMIPNIIISFMNSSGTTLGTWYNPIYYSNFIATTKIPIGTFKINIIYTLTNNDANAGNYAIFKNIQIEKGNNYTKFEEYYENDLGTIYDSSVDKLIDYKEINIIGNTQVLKLYEISNSNFIKYSSSTTDYSISSIMYNFLPNYSNLIENNQENYYKENSHRLSFIKQVAHRGFSIEAPENTLSAFKLAKLKGFDYVECDVQYTSDNIPVLLHDTTINRTSNGTGAISSLTYLQARSYDFGSWKSSVYAGEKIPSFEEFLITLKRIGLNAYVEIKSSDITNEQIELVVNLAKKYGMLSHITWICTNISKLDVVLSLQPKSKVGYVIDGDITSTIINDVLTRQTNNNYIFLDCNIEKLTESGIQLAIDENIDLEAWTVDDSNVVLNMNKYITGITTNGFNLSYYLYNYELY